MKNFILYGLMLSAIAALSFYGLRKEKMKEETFQPIKERMGMQANNEEWKKTKLEADSLFARLNRNPSDKEIKMKLAAIYIQEGRITADHIYYDAAAMQLVNSVLKTDSNNFLALCYKSVVFLSQ